MTEETKANETEARAKKLEEFLKIKVDDSESTQAAKKARMEFEEKFGDITKQIHEWTDAKREEVKALGIDIGYLMDITIQDDDGDDYGMHGCNIEGKKSPRQSAAIEVLRDRTGFLPLQVKALRAARKFFGGGGLGLPPVEAIAGILAKLESEK